MDCIILAAGLGNRLKDLTTDRPKAMVEVLKKPLIEYSFKFIQSNEVNNIYIVGGYRFEVLQKHVAGKAKTKIFLNPDYQKGSTLTVEKAIDQVNGSFLLMNVDHIYPPAMFEKILKNSDDDKIIAMVDSDRQLVADDMKVEFRNGSCIKRISKTLEVFQAGYIGMTFIGKNRLPLYKQALKDTIKETEGKGNVEAILDYLSKSHDIHTLDLSGFGWYEVDDQHDLKKAEDALK